jgi:hypothetical protein
MDRKPIQAWIFAFSSTLLPPAINDIYQNGFGSRQQVTYLVLAVFIGLIGVFWPSIASKWPTLAASGAKFGSDARSWVGVFLLLWLGVTVPHFIFLSKRDRRLTEIVEKDINPFRLALQRWVLPRRLTPQQSKVISEHLKKYKSHEVYFSVLRHDDEADGYHNDLRRAFDYGGWVVLGSTERPLEQKPGVTIELSETSETRPSDDSRNPRPDRILEDALRQAGVQIGGSWSGPGQVEKLTVKIGRRPGDTTGEMQDWPYN